MWGDALVTYIAARNARVDPATGISAHEAMFGHKPDISALAPFWSIVGVAAVERVAFHPSWTRVNVSELNASRGKFLVLGGDLGFLAGRGGPWRVRVFRGLRLEVLRDATYVPSRVF